MSMFAQSITPDVRKPSGGAKKPWTGRTVLLALCGFFGVMLIANGFFVYFALTSFPGLETESAYMAGKAYPTEIEAAAAQNARGWSVDLHVARDAQSGTVLTVEPRDANGGLLPNLNVRAHLTSVRGEELDHDVTFAEVETGRYSVAIDDVQRGRWSVHLNIYRGEERLYRSNNKLYLQ